MTRRDLFATILIGLATVSVTAYAADAPASAPASSSDPLAPKSKKKNVKSKQKNQDPAAIAQPPSK